MSAVSQVPVQVSLKLASKFQGLFKPKRYKVFWGGRGGAKSWAVADYLIARAMVGRERIGCFREFQNSIKDSVLQLLKDRIEALGVQRFFTSTQTSVYCLTTGSEFLFKGLRHNATEIKSTEGITIAWVEEAQLVSKDSWELLIPTIRTEGSEIIVTFNPIEETDDTYERFVPRCLSCNNEPFTSVGEAEDHEAQHPEHEVRLPPPDAIVQKVNWSDNPWFPVVLDLERQHMLQTDPDAYEHVWGGRTRKLSGSVIFAGKYQVSAFGLPTDPHPERLYLGLDFGYAEDPNAFSCSWITGQEPNRELWIWRTFFSRRVEINDLGGWMKRELPLCVNWPIKADNSRPETISYLRRQDGLNISAAEKWPGCIEDRIAHLKGFRVIHIEASQKEMQQEARLYSWKVDKQTKQILPEAVDAHNHGWDANGYGLDGLILARGSAGVWGRL